MHVVPAVPEILAFYSLRPHIQMNPTGYPESGHLSLLLAKPLSLSCGILQQPPNSFFPLTPSFHLGSPSIYFLHIKVIFLSKISHSCQNFTMASPFQSIKAEVLLATHKAFLTDNSLLLPDFSFYYPFLYLLRSTQWLLLLFFKYTTRLP